MKWTVLVDNRTINPSLETEHGLAILLETEQYRLLLDTGASDKLLHNATVLGVDLSNIDYVFISHGHNDHAGGLRHFLSINDKAKIIVSPQAREGKFFSKRHSFHDISTTWPSIKQERLLLATQNCEIVSGIHVTTNIKHIHPRPKGNNHLFTLDNNGNIINDDFNHEIALWTDGFLFTGCAHNGLENILEACHLPTHTVLGGFHLLDGYESQQELMELGHRLSSTYPKTQFYTSHCTGNESFDILNSAMPMQLHHFSCGMTCSI